MTRMTVVVLICIILTVVVTTAYNVGVEHGVQHALGDAQFSMASSEHYVDPTGAEFAASILIELDGQLYEQGLTTTNESRR